MNTILNSESTGVACKNTNRKFIGIELNEHYFKIASDRIDTTILGSSLANEIEPKTKIKEKLF